MGVLVTPDEGILEYWNDGMVECWADREYWNIGILD